MLFSLMHPDNSQYILKLLGYKLDLHGIDIIARWRISGSLIRLIELHWSIGCSEMPLYEGMVLLKTNIKRLRPISRGLFS